MRTDKTEEGETFRVRTLAFSVYLPHLLFAIGQGAAIPMIALLALDLGASVATAGAVVALRGIGTMVFDLPAGLLVAKLGERKAMVVATGVLAAIAAGVSTRPSPLVYALFIFLLGGAWSVWVLARLTYTTELTPIEFRGRVMSVMGGLGRTGTFIGPLIAGLTVTRFGLASAFVVQAVMATAACIALATGPTPPPHEDVVRPTHKIKLREVLMDHRKTLATAGLATVAIMILRTSRQVMLPLWGNHIGLTPGSIALLFSVSSALEMTLFYPVGLLMDRRGRRWAAIPCLALLSLGMALIPLTNSFLGMVGAALVMGLGNGFGTGIGMTLGSDFSPAVGRSQFLGVWRLVTDVGTAGGPLIIAATTSLASLGTAALVSSGVGLVGMVLLWLAVPETLKKSEAAALADVDD
ncbi:MAG TPA: MFS transporter [Acidimicrobiia bacterium]|nr:MFS transporter [Acidimicrobiia bacterium]